MKMQQSLIAMLMAAFMIVAAACGGGETEPADTAPASSEPQPTTSNPNATDPAGGGDLVATGQQVFTGAGICFTCHGQDAKGTQLAPNLTDDEWINIEQPVTVDKIVQLVRTGVAQPKQHPAPMPPMGGAQLTDDQIQAVATYVDSLTP